MGDEARLRAFGGLIVRLQQRQDLTRDEARAAFNEIRRNEQPDLQQGAFIAALHGKGETRDEILGVAESHNDDWSRHVPGQVSAPEPHLGIVGVGLDTLKTVNVSSGAAIIAAACGVYIHKIAAPGMTGVSGSAETFAMLGVDPDVDHATSCRATEQSRLGFTSVVGRAARATGIFRVASQLRCGTSLHIAGPMGFHSGERHKIVGVPRPDLVPLVCGAMKELGYRRALVPCGGALQFPGRYMDEFSTVGPTMVAELHEDGRITEYEVRPEDAGLVPGRYEDVAAAPSAQENVRAVAQALAGIDRGPVLDLLALNAAACLKLMGKVESWQEGVARARAAVAEGAALEQLRNLILAQNADPVSGLARLQAFIDGAPFGGGRPVITEWAHVGGGRVVVATSRGAWQYRSRADGLPDMFDVPMRGRGTTDSTRWLLDGAIGAAASGRRASVAPLPLTPIRWLWRLAGFYLTTEATSRLMPEAARRFAAAGQRELADWAVLRGREETGHDQLALRDIRALGYEPRDVLQRFVPPAATALVDYFTGTVLHAPDPIGCVGYAYALERLAAERGTSEVDAVQAILPRGVNATRCLRVHSAAGSDAQHVAETIDTVARLSPAHRAAVARACFETARLFYVRRAAPPADRELSERLQSTPGVGGFVADDPSHVSKLEDRWLKRPARPAARPPARPPARRRRDDRPSRAT